MHNLGKSNRAIATLTSKGHNLFATVHGSVSLDCDRATIDRLWNRFVAAWYEGGKDDPRLALFCGSKSPHSQHGDFIERACHADKVRQAQFCDRRHGAFRSDALRSPHHSSLGEKNGYDQKCRDCGSRLRTLGLPERSVRWLQTFGRTPVRMQGRRIQTVQRIAGQHGRRCRMPASEKVPS